MEHKQISIYSSDKVISRIFVYDDNGREDCDKASLEELLRCLELYRHIFILVDRNLLSRSQYVSLLVDGLEKQKGCPVLPVDASEQNKTMDSVLSICSWLLDKGADRDALVLAVGGGITTDMAGFAASVYKRGVRFAFVPTTLLSQVDAAIGGKTGVNFEKYKNIIGVIRHPEFTFISPYVLKSLPYRDLLSGAAEMIKTFLIEDNGCYDRAVAFFRELHREMSSPDHSSAMEISGWTDGFPAAAYWNRARVSELAQLIAAAAAVKAGVVSRDQYEGGERRKLNLGHTFGHAIETLARRKNLDITHGEAVAMGMVLAARLADRSEELSCNTGQRTFSAPGIAQRIEKDLKECGLPVKCPFTMEEMCPVMTKDKKAEGDAVHFVLPVAVGNVVVRDFAVGDVYGMMEPA